MKKYINNFSLITLLFLSCYILGNICWQFSSAYNLIFSPSRQIFDLLLTFFLSISFVIISAALIAILLRPVWLASLAFAAGSIAILLNCGITKISLIIASLFFFSGTVYCLNAANELNQRIKLSVRVICGRQNILWIVLILTAAVNFYSGYAQHVKNNGFKIPDNYINMLIQQIEKPFLAQIPADKQNQVIPALRDELKQGIYNFLNNNQIKSYEKFIPLILTISIFTSLLTIFRLLSWIPLLITKLIISFLKTIGYIKIITQNQPVEKLVVE